METWRDVPGYPGYQTSDHGRLRSNKLGYWRVSKASANDQGYFETRVRVDGKPRLGKIHILVALAWLGPRPPDYVINHKDGVKTHNSPSNLEYVSHRENDIHAHRLGLTPKPPVKSGSANNNARFTESEIREIRQRWADGDKQTEIAKRFNCRQGVIANIVARRTWAHISEAA